MSAFAVNFNAEASNALLNLDQSGIALSKSISELSSGLAVQYSEQGPAAWSISNSLKLENAGDTQAIGNCQQGVSILNIASGAINQMNRILDQMEQLATSSANSGAMTATQLAANESQYSALTSEINQIVANTTYGDKPLLDGSYGAPSQSIAGTVPVAADAPYNITIEPNFQIWIDVNGPLYEKLNIPVGSYNASQLAGAINASPYLGLGANPVVPIVASVNSSGDLVLTSYAPAGDTVQVDPGSPFINGAGSFPGVPGSGPFINVNDLQQFQVGYQSNNTIDVAIPDLTAAGLGLTGTDVSTASDASVAISAVQNALTELSTAGATVGSYANELQGLGSDQQTTTTNVAAANSSIVDANMAQEMTNFTTQQILMQSGLAMLGQAQANPTLVLKLL